MEEVLAERPETAPEVVTSQIEELDSTQYKWEAEIAKTQNEQKREYKNFVINFYQTSTQW